MSDEKSAREPIAEDARIDALEARLKAAREREEQRNRPQGTGADANYRSGNRVLADLLGGLLGGTVIGCGILAFFYNGQRITPISPLGFLVATGGAFIILAFYRLLAGYFFVEGETSPRRHIRRRRAVRYHDAHVED